MTKANISVVVPSCNRSDVLRSTLASIFAQKVQPREVIVVDDGSDCKISLDGLVGACDVRLIRQDRAGVQAARNAGFRVALSDWVATIDDDDIYQDDYFRSLVPIIEEGKADVIVTDHRKFRQAKPYGRTNFELAPKGYWEGICDQAGQDWTLIAQFPLDKLLAYVPFYPSGMAIRKSVFEGIGGYDPRIRGVPSEDIEFLVRALARSRVAVLWRPLVNYRVHAGNTSGGDVRRAVGRWRIFEFVQATHADLPPRFRLTLERDLARRRPAIFDLAFEIGDFALLEEVGASLSSSDWSARRQLARAVANLPRRMAKPVTTLTGAPQNLHRALRRHIQVWRGIKA